MQSIIVTRKEMDTKLTEMRTKYDSSIDNIVGTFVARVHKTLHLKGLIGMDEKYTSINDWVQATETDVVTVREEVLNPENGLKTRMGAVETVANDAKSLGEANDNVMNELKGEVIEQMKYVETRASKMKEACFEKINHIDGAFGDMQQIMAQNSARMDTMQKDNKELSTYIDKMDQMNVSLSSNTDQIGKIEAKMERLDEAMLQKISKNKSSVEKSVTEI